jgi:hypothetical protein
MPSSAPPQFRLGPGIWASTPEPVLHNLLHRYAVRARKLLARFLDCIPDNDRLQLIVGAALEARALFWAAAVQEPSTEDLDQFFDEFVTRSVAAHDSNEARNDD